MLILFLRACLLYLLVFVVLRLTGKRQVSDLQPFDLLITLMIADLASCAIADTNIPLAYSAVPILALYLMQTFITYVCLKNARLRNLVCGRPVILVADGVLQEGSMRRANYTIIDLMDQLRAKDVFDIGNVAYAILETNGSMSVLQRGECQTPTLKDLDLPPEDAHLSHMLVLDGRLCVETVRACGLSEAWVQAKLSGMGAGPVRNVFYLSLSPDGTLRAQTRERAGKRVLTLQTEATHV
jgi:uncharacterized membrane protein YcaP (DUF421 family)